MNINETDGAGGFFLALFMLDNMGVAFDRRELLKRLEEVASGDVTAFGGPEEELTIAERRRGTALADEERETLVTGLKARRDLDLYVQELAGGVLHAGQR